MNTHASTIEDRTLFGFWLYILSDCVLFAALFATFAVLRGATAGAASGQELLDLPYLLAQTLLLLASSYTMGIALLQARDGALRMTLGALAATTLLGLGFLALEVGEFVALIREGNGPDQSAFLSAFFTLVGTHGLHVLAGLVWMALIMAHLYRRGISSGARRKLKMLALFWHFLDIIWIGVFTVVYLLSATV